jgi:hypothetical protein
MESELSKMMEKDKDSQMFELQLQTVVSIGKLNAIAPSQTKGKSNDAAKSNSS